MKTIFAQKSDLSNMHPPQIWAVQKIQISPRKYTLVEYIAGTTIRNLIIITHLFCVHPLSSSKSRFDLVF